MLKIEKIKDEIKNFDTDVTADENLSCWLYRITTNPSINKHNCSGLVCSECLRRSLLDLLEEYKEPIKLTKLEHEYLKVAKKEGFEQISDLFLKTANNEKEHAKMWFKEMEGISDTATNLKAAADGENYEWTDMYLSLIHI